MSELYVLLVQQVLHGRSFAHTSIAFSILSYGFVEDLENLENLENLESLENLENWLPGIGKPGIVRDCF